MWVWTTPLLEIPNCGCMLCQHALEDCTTKFESKSLRILLSGTTTVKSKMHDTLRSQKSEGTKVSEIVAPLHYCALQRTQKFAD